MNHRRLNSLLRLLLGGSLVLLAGLTCTDGGLTGPRSNGGVFARLGFAPAFTRAATEIFQNLEAFGYEVNNVHVHLKHANGSIAKDTIVAIGAGQDSVVIQLNVSLNSLQEDLEAGIELRDDDVVLFSGTQTVTAKVGGTPAPAPAIPVDFSGPGAGATSLALTPHDTVIIAGQSLTLQPSAKNSSGQTITNLALAWSVKDPTRGTVTGTGVFTALTGVGRGETYVISRLLSGPRDSAHIVVSLPASKVALISGIGTGTVGKPLTQNIVVETRASDDLVVPFTPVTFSVVSGGGSLSAAAGVTDASGRASFSATLGTAAGANVFQVSGAGLTPLVLTISGQPDQPSKLAMVQQPSAATQAGATLPTQPSARLQDAFGNNAPVANVPVTVSLTSANGRTLSGTLTVNTDASGVAQFTDLKITGPVGPASLTFSQTGLTSVVSNAIDVAVGAPTVMTLTGSTSFTAVAGALMTNAPTIQVTDAGGNGVPNVTLTVAVSGVDGPIGSTNVPTDANGRLLLSTIPAKPTAGAYTFTVSNAALAGSPISVLANVTNDVATHLRYLQQPANATAGASIVVAVEVLDQFNNRVTVGAGATANITLALAGGTTGAVLGPTAGVTQAAANGVATFGVNVSLAGTAYTLNATAPDLGLPALASNAFNVGAGAPANVLAMLGEGAGVLRGGEQRLVVRVTDAGGTNIVGTPVTFAISSGGGTLNSSTAPQTQATATDGTASADFRPGPSGVQMVRASAGGVFFDFHLFVAETLAVIREPSATPQSGVPFTVQPRVALRDQLGNAVRLAGVDLTAAVILDPALQDVIPATLGGTLVARTDVNGEATWTDLALTGQLQTVRLAVSQAGATPTIQPTQSQLLGLEAGAASRFQSMTGDQHYLFDQTSSNPTIGVRVTDSGNNPIANSQIRFLMYLPSPSCQLADSVATTDASGVAQMRISFTAPMVSCVILAQPRVDAPPVTEWVFLQVYNAPVNGAAMWLGRTSTDWNDATNWYQGLRPTTFGSVYIPGASLMDNIATVADDTTRLTSLYVEQTATMDLNGRAVQVSADLDAQGQMTGNGTVIADGSTGGQFRTGYVQGLLSVTGRANYTLSGIVVADSLSIDGTLTTAAGLAISVNGSLHTQGAGRLYNQTGGVILVGQDAIFNGAVAEITSGNLEIGRHFVHNGDCSAQTFHSQGGIVTMHGDATQLQDSLRFTWNSTCGSRLGQLFIATVGPVALTTSLSVPALPLTQLLIGSGASLNIPAQFILTFDANGGIDLTDAQALLRFESAVNIPALVCTPGLNPLNAGPNVGPLSCR